jgi:CheY-like chemotaxis protein
VLHKNPQLKIVDITGGAPELNPNFRWFVGAIKNLNRHVIDRCNLTIILSNKRFNDLPDFFKQHNIEVICSLPFYTQDRTDRQRGNGVDMILMDVQMPEMDGLEATRMIRTCLEIQPIIIAVTANVMQGDRDACMQAGMDDYISKPIGLKESLSQLGKMVTCNPE